MSQNIYLLISKTINLIKKGNFVLSGQIIKQMVESELSNIKIELLNHKLKKLESIESLYNEFLLTQKDFLQIEILNLIMELSDYNKIKNNSDITLNISESLDYQNFLENNFGKKYLLNKSNLKKPNFKNNNNHFKD